MKIQYKLLFTGILFCLVVPCFSQDPKFTWDYPIKPGTEQWEELDTYEKRLNAYNIPATILSKMNTSELVKTCLNYPEFRLIMTRNSLQIGYDYLKTIFNGFNELEKRVDSGKELLKVIELMEPQKIIRFDTPAKRGAFSFQFTCIELIMAQTEIQKNLSKEDIRKFFETYTRIYEEKIMLENEYSMFSIGTTVLAMARLLNQEKYQDFNQMNMPNSRLHDFVEKSYGAEMGDYNVVYNYSRNYLKTLKNE